MKASIYENGLMGTVSDANKIVVLENGIVNESGSPAELYARGRNLSPHGRAANENKIKMINWLLHIR